MALRRLKPNPDVGIRAALGSTYWYTVDELAAATGLRAGTVRARLTDMLNKGEVRRQPGQDGKQVWRGVR